MRPALKAGLLPLWRDRDTLQFGTDPRRAVAMGGLGQAAAVISLLDGSRDGDQLIAAAQASGVPAQAAGRVLALLAEAGVLDDYPSGLHASLPDRVRARLGPELATAALAYADTDGGARVLARRQGAFVRVHGAGRTGACVATFLAASGVGQVTCTDPELAEPADLTPAGLTVADLGQPRQDGAARAVERACAGTRTGDDGAVPDLVDLDRAGAAGPDQRPGPRPRAAPGRVGRRGDRRDRAAGPAGTFGLPALRGPAQGRGRSAVAEDRGPGHLRAPGPAAGLRHRAGRHDGRAGLRAGARAHRPGRPARPAPATVGGTLEVVLPDWQWRRRTWPPHPACGCGAAAAANRNGTVPTGLSRNDAVTDAP